MDSNTGGDRIAKVIARAGICSRRDAENLILNGRVKIDGVVIDTPAIRVTSANKILVDNKPIPAIGTARLWMFYKPRGCLTTNKDPRGRTTIFSFLPKTLPRVVTVGRLDYNSEGLLLLTNDGGLARHMELPANGWVRRYRARAYGAINMDAIEQIRKGVEIEGVQYEPAKVEIEKAGSGDNTWIHVAVTEGKNREVRRLLDFAGLEVNRLIRTTYGPFKIGTLDRCGIEEIPHEEFKEKVGWE
jgi:23S rRNA pseudouridine2605 synthase